MRAGDAPASVWRTFAALALPHRRRFAWVAVLALLGTATQLVGPLIYRAAVNDIAGLFVGAPGDRGIDTLVSDDAADVGDALGAVDGGAAEDDTADAGVDDDTADGGVVDDGATPAMEPHRRGQVSSRTPRQTLDTLLWSVALLFLVSVVSHWFALLADQQTALLACRIEGDVIQRTFGHVLKLPLPFFAKRSSGGLAKQVDQLDQVSPIVTAAANQVAPELLRMLGVLVIMMTQSHRLTLIALVTLPLYVWVVRRSASRLETGLGRYYEMWEGVSARIQQALAGIKTVKLSGAEAREASRLAGESTRAYDTFVERNRLANRYVFWQASLAQLSRALVLGYGGWLVLEHQLTPGDVVMFVVYLDQLFNPIESLTSLGFALQEHVASLKRAAALLALPGEEAAGEPLAPGPGRVEMTGVRFGYAPGQEVLKGVDLVLEPGKVTALVGPSGAGKTTAIDLLLKLQAPWAGDVRLDGQSLAALDASAVRQAMGVVAADGTLFSGTLADNLRYKRPDATDDEVRAAALAAGLERTLARLPDGLESAIGEGGLGLSVGERQRVQIARALVGRPRVLVLDEATANLDYATEEAVRTALLEATPRPTTLVVAHRFSMVAGADHVYVLADGVVREHGTVDELVARGGWFAEFARSAGHGAEAATPSPADDDDDD